MKNTMELKTTITIHASAAEIWKAITTPATISQYLMGTKVHTDWKEGSAITYEGEYDGKKYKDKGTIRQFVPEKIFQSTYWSSMGGKPDKPENYNLVTYKLTPKGKNSTQVALLQDNVGSEKEKKHLTDNWKMVLKGLKSVVETEKPPG
jgi:uncharacterized protein YndB with AHSA1/START domain